MQQAKANVQKLNQFVLLAFAAVALVLVYWSVFRADGLAARDDNPRQVALELGTQRGTIYDTNNQPLAWSEGEERVVRSYAEASGAAVGYYSFRFGATGIEQGMDAHLRGTDGPYWPEFVRDVLHQPRVGRDVRLTVDGRWQLLADKVMAGQSGAAVLVSLPDNALRMLASYPSFDPNVLDTQFDVLSDTVGAPLLNRATLGVYQPGGVLQPFLYASAIENNLLGINASVQDGAATVTLGDLALDCVRVDSLIATNADALRGVCPAPLVQLGEQLSLDDLSQFLDSYGFADDPQMPFPIEMDADGDLESVRNTLVGQGVTTVTPLQVAVAWAGLASQGDRQPLRLVSAIESLDGQWRSQVAVQDTVSMVSQTSAETVINSLARSGSLIEHVAFAIADTDGSQTIWYLALGPTPSPRYALTLVIEDSDVATGQAIGRALMQGVLTSR